MERLALACLLLMPSLAHAGNCAAFYQRQTYYAAPVVAYAAPVYYQAGRDLEAEALAEKVARLAVPKIVAQLQAANLRQGYASQQQAAPPNAVSQHCGKCHGGAAPKGGIVLDGTSPVPCEVITRSLRQISVDKMPRDHKLTPEQKGAIMQSLLDLEADRSQQVEVLPPQPVPEGELK